MKTLISRGLSPIVAGIMLLPFTAAATPAFNWDFQTYYPHADPLQASLTSGQLASINTLDGKYTTALVNATGPGLTQAQLDEVADIPAYFLLSRDPQTGVLSGRPIILDDDDSPAVPDTSQPASFCGDFVPKVIRLCDLYAKATPAQAPQLEAVHSDLIELFLNQNYLPGGQAIRGVAWYNWMDYAPKALRMLHKLSPDKRDLFALSYAYISAFSELMVEDVHGNTDSYYTGFPTAHRALALMSDTPAKWQFMKLLRRGLDLSIIGKEEDPGSPLVPLDGSIIHHEGHNVHYAGYSYGGMLQDHVNWASAGITSDDTATAIERMRKGALAWCFATTGGLNPLHQAMETQLRAADAPSDGGAGSGLDFVIKAARLKAAYEGTSIADDLEMAYAAIAKTGVGSTSLPVEWRGIAPPSNIDPTSPHYTASLMGSFSHTTNGTSIRRGAGQWYASLRGQPTHWRGGESRYNMGDPTHFNVKAMHGSLMLITTGKDGRKPNEVDSGYFRDGWDYSYFPNVTCPEIPLDQLFYWRSWAYYGGESNLTGGADLRDSGVWMMKGSNCCKSAFLFGNKIVAVNNNITGSNLHTGLIQYGHRPGGTGSVVLNGTAQTLDGEVTLAAGGNHKIEDPQGNGYFVHAGAGTPAIKASRGNQSTTYELPENWIGPGPAPSDWGNLTYVYPSDFFANLNNFTPTTANFSKVRFDHGASATNQAMEYTVLVKPQPGELDTYATAMADPVTAPVKVTKSPKIHRYLDRASGTCAAAVFDSSEPLEMHELVSVNRPGAYIWRNQDGLLRLSISSSETENTSAFQVTVKEAWTLESQEGTYNNSATATSSSGNTVVSLSHRDAPQSVVLRRVGSSSAPTWFNGALSLVNASFGTPFSGTLAGEVEDVDGHTFMFSKVAGPAWLNVAANGTLSGTQSVADGGVNVFTIRVTDSSGAYSDLTLTVTVFIPVGNGTWTNVAGGAWNNSANWSGGNIANGTDKIADFSTLNLANDAAVTLDGDISVGGLKFGDTTPNKNWTLNPSGGLPLDLGVSTGTPTITVNNQTATINAVLAGTQGLLKSGSGALTLAGANTYKGQTTVGANGSTSGGTLTVSGNQGSGGWRINNGTVNFQSGTSINVASGNSISTASGTGNNLRNLNVAGTVVNAGSLSLDGGATFNLNSGADWAQAGSMSVKSGSTFTSGVLNVNSGAIFKYTGTAAITLSASSGSNGGSGTLSIAGGSFETGRGFVNSGGTAGSANLKLSNGGMLKLTGSIATLASNSGTTTPFNVQVGTGGGIIDTNGFATTITQGIANVSGQTGSLTKQGAGTLTLSGGNTYTGTTTVTEGTLAGGGSVAGPVNVQSGGTLAPDGTLTVSNTLTLAGSVQMKLSKTGSAVANDKVSGVTTVTYGGTLTVSHLGPDPLAAGDSFQLFAATTYSGGFSGRTLPTLAPNLMWDISKLAVNGSIGVRALPVAMADSAATVEDTAVTIPVLVNDSDADGDPLAIVTVTQGSHGSVVITGNQVSYTPAPNWHGSDSFSYTITDNREGEATAQVTVTVSPVNDAPLLGPLADALATEDSAFTGLLTASDADAGQALSYSKVGGPGWLTIATDGTLGGTPLNGDVGSNDFTLRVTDASQAYSEATLHITVANTNDAPVFTLTPITAPAGNENQAYNASISGSATDVDTGDTLTYSITSGPAWLNIAGDGSLFGVPGSGDTGANTFTVRVTDEADAFVETTLHVSVATLGDNGVWTNASGGSWNTGSNWSGGVPASGANRSANFSTLNLTANATVSLNGTRTLGSLIFGDTTPSHAWTLATGSGGPLRLETSGDSPVITVANSSATLSVAIAGTQGLTKAGAGTLNLTGANTYSGPTIVNAGTLSLANRVLHDASIVTIASGAVLNLNFTGSDQIGALIIGGNSLPAGTYGAKTHPGVLTGSGRLKVGTISAILPPDLDSDQDGLSDRIEFVFGSDPHTPNASGLLARKTGDQFILTFNRDDISEEVGLQLSVEAGPALGTWPQVFQIGDSTVTSSAGVTIEENGEAPDIITVTITANNAANLFARVKVEAGN